MSIDIRLPNINGATNAEQIAQMRSYLYQFAEQLNWALRTLESGQSSESVVVQETKESSSSETKSPVTSTFSEIKALIIKSADIVEAYYQEIDKMLEASGKYVAQADFGDGGAAQYVKLSLIHI